MTSKVCTKCGETKQLDGFHNHKGKPFGKAIWCKVCAIENATSHRKRADPKEVLKNKRAWQDKNRQHVNSYNANWRRNNPEKHAARQAKRRSDKLNATPNWLSGSQEANIKRLYLLAKIISDETGLSYHVDHIVPLKGDSICGLHVPWNLQVLRGDLNLKKSNTFDGGD